MSSHYAISFLFSIFSKFSDNNLIAHKQKKKINSSVRRNKQRADNYIITANFFLLIKTKIKHDYFSKSTKTGFKTFRNLIKLSKKN